MTHRTHITRFAPSFQSRVRAIRNDMDWPMNILSRDKQIEIIAALTGVGIRATARLVGINRETVGRLALHVGKGCVEFHDRRMVGVRVNRIELDEVWSFVGKKQKRVKRHKAFAKGDQYGCGVSIFCKPQIKMFVSRLRSDNSLI
jgi:hypothetical protein